jgi:AcrR family transcriptional regulator
MSAEPIDAEVRPLAARTESRGLATRRKLLEATIECLFTLGYHRTSTVLVTERAGVSRGSLLHQFPTKVDLMVETVRYIAHQRHLAHKAAVGALPYGPRRIARLVDTLWGEISAPSGIARLEIMMASRSDPELAAKLTPLNARLEQRHRDRMWRMAEALGCRDRAPIDAMAEVYINALRGLAIDNLFPDSSGQIKAAVDLLKETMIALIEREAAKSA